MGCWHLRQAPSRVPAESSGLESSGLLRTQDVGADALARARGMPSCLHPPLLLPHLLELPRLFQRGHWVFPHNSPGLPASFASMGSMEDLKQPAHLPRPKSLQPALLPEDARNPQPAGARTRAFLQAPSSHGNPKLSFATFGNVIRLRGEAANKGRCDRWWQRPRGQCWRQKPFL